MSRIPRAINLNRCLFANFHAKLPREFPRVAIEFRGFRQYRSIVSIAYSYTVGPSVTRNVRSGLYGFRVLRIQEREEL